MSELEVSDEGLRKVRSSRPDYGHQSQNWSDFFFMLDILSSNSSVCDVLLFISKIDDQITGKVSFI